MFSDGAAAPFRFVDVILMFALNLFLLGLSFVCRFPWFLGLFPNAGW